MCLFVLHYYTVKSPAPIGCWSTENLCLLKGLEQTKHKSYKTYNIRAFK